MKQIDTTDVIRAYKAARFMKYVAAPIGLIGTLMSVILGFMLHWAGGLCLFLAFWLSLFIKGYRNARCPSCEQLWWSWVALLFIAPWWIVFTGLSEMTDELDSMICRKCNLEIGPHLKELQIIEPKHEHY